MDIVSRRILLVEDNEDDYLIVRDLLSDITTTAFDIQWVDNYQDARASLARQQYDVCLLDYRLGEATGVDLVREFGSGDTPFILLTGNEDYEVDVTAAKAGVADYLVKGHINAPLLERSIRYAVEHKWAAAAERESRQFLQSTLDALRSHIAVLDGEGTIIAVNQAWQRFFETNDGTAMSCGVGTNYLEVCSSATGAWAEEAPAVLQGIREVMLGRQQQFSLEYPCHSPYEKRWFNVSVTRFASEGPLRVAVAHENITERKQAEESLRQSEERFAGAFEYAPIGVALVSPNGRWLQVNRQLCEVLGYSENEMIHRTFQDITHPDDLEEDLENARQLLAGEIRSYQMEKRYFHARGHIITVLLNVSLIRSAEGQPLYFISQIQDITERKQTETALRESNEKFHQLADNISDAFWMRSPDMREVEYLSPSFERIWGRSMQSLRENAEQWTDFIVPEDRERVLAAYAALMHDAASISPEYRIVRPDGEVRWVLTNGFQVRNAAGELIRLTGISSDITMRRAAEEKIRFQAHLLNEVGQAIIATDLEGIVLYWNRHAEELYGWTAQEATGRSIESLVVPEMASEQAIEIMAKLNRGETWSGEFAVQHRDGTTFPAAVTNTPIYDESGALSVIIGISSDITEHKQAQAALQQANNELELRVQKRTAELERSNRELQQKEERLLQGNTIFTDLTRLHVTTDEELMAAISQVNEAGSALLDAERCSVWLYNEDSTAIRCFNLYERASGRHTQGVELSVANYPDYFRALATRNPIVADDAHTHPATHEFSEGYLTPLGIASMLDIPIVIGGQMVGVLCCEHIGEIRQWKVEDQTLAGSAASLCSLALESHERTRAERALHRANEESEASRREAERANMAKSEFLSRMSHELRTPLNAILGFGQILDREVLDPLCSESVGYILRGGRHLLDLINEVLDIARVESGHIDLSLEPVALDDIVPESCALVGPLASERGISLNYDIGALGRHHVLADHQRLKQVLLNLLSNAIKYNRPGGEVTITCHAIPDERLCIALQDTGPGIAPDDLPKLFTPFERLGAANSEIEGTGLGLPLAQRIVTAMDGTLRVESVVGQGSTFSIELPRAICPQKSLETLPGGASDAGMRESAARPCIVLYIEDNLSNLRLIEAILRRRPEITLISAMQGSVGLDLARQHEPDLILLDLNLPDIHGSEVLARLQQSALTREIPVVVISADATPRQVERLLDAGASAYLTKPLDVNLFLDNINTLLQTPQTPKAGNVVSDDNEE